MCARVVIEEPRSGISITRFDVQQRAQHILLIASFFFLAITGLPLKYSEWGISGWWIGVWGSTDNVRVVHHYAAWVMIAIFAYHIMYLAVSRPVSLAALPKPSDIKDFIQDLKHTFHLSKKPPQYDRFPYRNKGAYWLVYPGGLIMAVTGFILLYPTGVTAHLPGWTLPLALMIHSDAAILAIGWVLFVHVYFAHFSKHTFPFDKSIITGKVPVERYKEEFPLEYARIVATERIALPERRRLVREPEEAPEFGEPTYESELDLGGLTREEQLAMGLVEVEEEE